MKGRIFSIVAPLSLSLFFFSLVSPDCAAQAIIRLVGGYNVTSFVKAGKNASLYDYSSTSSVHVGAALEIPLGQKMAFATRIVVFWKSLSFYFLAGAGLYMARGLMTANYKAVYEQTIKFGGEGTSYSNTYSPYDFGYTLLTGLEWRRLQFLPCISNGLIKANPDPAYTLKNSAFSLSVSYRL